MELYKRGGRNGVWHVGEGYNKKGVLIPRHTTKCRDRKAAQAYLDDVVDELTEWTGRRSVTKPAPVTVAPDRGLTLIDAMEKWLLKYARRPTTQDQFRRVVKVETIDALAKIGIKHLAEVGPVHVNDLQEGWLSRGLMLNAVLSYRNPSATMFNHFAKCEVIPRSPWKSIPAPKEIKPTIEEQVDGDAEIDEGRATLPLDPEGGDKNWQLIRSSIVPYLQARRFKLNQIALLPDSFLAFLELLYETGLRRGDATLFRPDKIRPTAKGGYSYKTMQTKTNRPVVVFLEPWLADKLRSLPKLSWRGPEMKTAGMYPFWDGSLGGLGRIRKYMDNKIGNIMRDMGEGLGFRVADDNSLRPHRFRDSFAVNMLNGGMALQDVSRMLGHKNVKITQDYYLPFVRSSEDALEARKFAARIVDYRAAEAAQANEDAVIVN